MTDGQDHHGIDPARARLIDSIYEAVLRPEHYDVFMADWAAHLDQAAERLIALRRANAGAFDSFDDPVIAGHFKRAFAMLERMGRGPAAEAARGVVNTERQPLLRISRDGILQGPASDGMEPGVSALPDGITDLAHLQARLEPDSRQRLAQLLDGLQRAPVVGQLAVLGFDPTPEAKSDGRAPPALSSGSAADGPAESIGSSQPQLLVAMTRRDSDGGVELALFPLQLNWSQPVRHALAGSFRLTPRELDLVEALASGADLAQIGQRSGRSLNTLRAQLKSVFQKTRTGSQAELMRLVAALILFAPGAEAAAVAADYIPDAGQVQMIPGFDGQPVPVHFIGPEDGQPVIFIHGMLDGISVTRHIGRALTSAGLRLIAPVRRNFGQAVPDPHLREAPEIFARELEAICAALGLRKVLLMGHMAGVIPAFAAACRLSAQHGGPRVTGVLNISGGVPIRSLRQFAVMSPRQRAVAYTARFAPALLPAILRVGIAQIDGKDADAFMAALYPEGSRDRQIATDPEIAATIIDGYRFSVAQGEQAFRIDSWHVTRDWSPLVAACPVPIRLIHGVLDPVVRIETVRDFAATSNRIWLDELPGEGQLLFYSQPQTVLAVAAEMLAA